MQKIARKDGFAHGVVWAEDMRRFTKRTLKCSFSCPSSLSFLALYNLHISF